MFSLLLPVYHDQVRLCSGKQQKVSFSESHLKAKVQIKMDSQLLKSKHDPHQSVSEWYLQNETRRNLRWVTSKNTYYINFVWALHLAQTTCVPEIFVCQSLNLKLYLHVCSTLYVHLSSSIMHKYCIWYSFWPITIFYTTLFVVILSPYWLHIACWCEFTGIDTWNH